MFGLNKKAILHIKADYFKNFLTFYREETQMGHFLFTFLCTAFYVLQAHRGILAMVSRKK
jgi:hypothetical protein